MGGLGDDARACTGGGRLDCLGRALIGHTDRRSIDRRLRGGYGIATGAGRSRREPFRPELVRSPGDVTIQGSPG